MKVALVHDWLTGMRGGEKCLEILCEHYPDAELHTLLHVRNRVSPAIEKMSIKTSFIQKLPKASQYYRYYLPLFPTAIEEFDLKEYDVIISTSHCVSKGVLPGPGSLHISYCFTPMRYAWDMHFDYFPKSAHRIRDLFVPFVFNYLRTWDVASSQRVDFFVAISHHVRRRIQRFYRRDSTVIYPPVDCDFFTPPAPPSKDGDYFLMVTALAPYKRVDLAVEAFNRLGKRLLIVGEGQGFKSLKRLAKTNVEFLGWQSDEKVRDYYRECNAFIFPGEEDFGIAPVEVQACGRPVIAYGRGGVLETVIPLSEERSTGVFFNQPTVGSLIEAVEVFERNRDRFDSREIRKNALKFQKDNFREKIKAFIDEKYQEFEGLKAKDSKQRTED